jgi:hypothetical protein
MSAFITCSPEAEQELIEYTVKEIKKEIKKENHAKG